jgi:hypothetical protein
MNTPADHFNEHMSAEGKLFRLVSMLGGEVMPSAASFEMRSIDPEDQTQLSGDIRNWTPMLPHHWRTRASEHRSG